MQLLHQLSFNNQETINCGLNTSGIFKVLFSGELAAEGKDHRLLIRFNGDRKSYRSFVHMGGDSSAGEWEDTGIYGGRNGWGTDAAFMLEYTFTINPNFLKIVGSGMSSFAAGDNRFLGYEAHGVYVSNGAVSTMEVGFTGGKVRKGDLLIYRV